MPEAVPVIVRAGRPRSQEMPSTTHKTGNMVYIMPRNRARSVVQRSSRRGANAALRKDVPNSLSDPSYSSNSTTSPILSLRLPLQCGVIAPWERGRPARMLLLMVVAELPRGFAGSH